MKYKPIMKKCHMNFTFFYKFVFQMCFQYTISMCKMYELWMNVARIPCGWINHRRGGTNNVQNFYNNTRIVFVPTFLGSFKPHIFPKLVWIFNLEQCTFYKHGIHLIITCLFIQDELWWMIINDLMDQFTN